VFVSFLVNPPSPSPLVIGGDPIEIVKETKLLGVLIADDQTWKSHINSITKNAAKRLFPIHFSKEIIFQTMFYLKSIIRAYGQF
jgi:hypothetical protein